MVMEKYPLKVLLIVPNFVWCDWDENTRWRFIPYNLCQLAAMVEDICTVKILDANARNLDDKGFMEELSDFDPDVVGITVLMDQYAAAGHHAAELVKAHDDSVTVVMGGVYTTMNPERALRDSNIDFVVMGEGEYVFRGLLNWLMEKGDMPGKGIAYCSGGGVMNGGHSDFIRDLDDLPLPRYELIDFKEYVSTVPARKSVDSPSCYPYARIITSRGCPYGCVFCQVESISGKTFRPRSPENILDEIAFLKESYGIKSLIFDDDNLYTHRKRAKEIFQGMMDRDLVMPWISISAAAFRMDDELIELMRKSGCEYINIAVESGSPRVLKEIVGKPLELEKAVHVTAKAREEGIYVAANFIIGFPTETWDEIRETIQFAEVMNADYVKIFVAIPLPHTKLLELCKKNNCLKKGFDPEKIRWSTGQIESSDFSARDLTILRAYEWDRINFTDPEKRKRTASRMNITEEELLTIRRRTLLKASHFMEE